MEHRPWIGDRYDRDADRLLVMGFSHHKRDDERDHPDFTVDCMPALALASGHWFFDRIARDFDQAPRDFWQRVAFANLLPTAVSGDDRFTAGTAAALARVPARRQRLLAELRPRKAILFSRKGWSAWGAFDGRWNGTHDLPVPAGAPWVQFGSHRTGEDRETIAYDLPHPMAQSIEGMRASVAAIMAHEPDA